MTCRTVPRGHCYVCEAQCGSPAPSRGATMAWTLNEATPPAARPRRGEPWFWLYGPPSAWWRTAYGRGAA